MVKRQGDINNPHIKLPRIIFTKWYSWSDRRLIENKGSPGVYLLAKFKKPPSGRANVLDKNIIYIGETCSSLHTRWYNFDRSAFQSKDGHSGGCTYNETYTDKGDDLYVAALPVLGFFDNIEPIFIRFIERKLILDYTLKYGRPPILNLK